MFDDDDVQSLTVEGCFHILSLCSSDVMYSCQQDFVVLEANHSLICNLHKCDLEKLKHPVLEQ